MDIFGGIEKLITEHGSATILKERLLLVADKYAALEKSLVECQTKTKDAVSEKQHFEFEGIIKGIIKGTLPFKLYITLGHCAINLCVFVDRPIFHYFSFKKY